MRRLMVVGGIMLISVAVLLMAVIFPGSPGRAGQEIAVIHVDGLITGGYSGSGVFGSAVGSQSVMSQLRQAARDDSIRAVVIRVNSPGGSAAASQEISREIEKLQKTGKLVVTSMGDAAASGGYWIASGTDYIFANEATMTGSIGVIMEFTQLKELYQKLGVDINVIKSGPHKDMGSPARDLTEQEREILQSMVDDIYEQFIQVVADGRQMSSERVKELADGRILTGRQAKELGLVDDMGNYYDAIDFAADKLGITGSPQVRTFGKPSALDIFLSGSSRMLHGLYLTDYRLLNPDFLSGNQWGDNYGAQ
ncbi:signal peptide peptidase SppA [Metallumcola ferriviriculae]|uniref:Signal peptide peptidase SppA n=1 Tax=Metallumcola ferriviriculae TaxID=3039180 RepID=A0AAU0UKP8_9FIRM|nr:signal peptide peptidase SppA [Desulfitibacteraceae bacterium MK1]